MFRYVFSFAVILAALAEEGGDSHVRKKRTLVVDVYSFRRECLESHNSFRAKHGVDPLRHSDELNSYAQDYANILAELDSPILTHSKTPYGENLYYKRGKADGYTPCEYWYSENRNYNYELETPPNLHEVGHFTQMIWKGSHKLGIGVATSSTGRTYVVCNYKPKGNIIGFYKENVFPNKVYVL